MFRSTKRLMSVTMISLRNKFMIMIVQHLVIRRLQNWGLKVGRTCPGHLSNNNNKMVTNETLDMN